MAAEYYEGVIVTMGRRNLVRNREGSIYLVEKEDAKTVATDIQKKPKPIFERVLV